MNEDIAYLAIAALIVLFLLLFFVSKRFRKYIINVFYMPRKERIKKYSSYILISILFCAMLYMLLICLGIEEEFREPLIKAVSAFIFICFICMFDTRGFDDAIFAFYYFSCALYCLNWFFEDFKKTLSFPLAFIFYSLMKSKLPNEIISYIDTMESYILFKNKWQNTSHKNKKSNKVYHYMRKSRKHFPVVFQKKKAGNSHNAPKN